MVTRTRGCGVIISRAILKLIILIIILALGKAVFNYLLQQYEMMQHPLLYSEYVNKFADENGVDKYLIYAIIKTESGFDPDSESHLGARGLMQIMDETFQWLEMRQGDDLSFSDMYLPKDNIKYGSYFIGYLLRYFENTECAVAAYHAGAGSVDSWLENPKYSNDGKTLLYIPTPDTAHYVEKINKSYEIYKKLYD